MYKILVVDDEPKIREVIKEYAEFSGFSVKEAEDGMTAVGLCKLNDYDLIIMDIMMPKMNGYEATKAIRALQNRPDARTIPIIAMTANAFAEDVQASLDAGMNDHLSKPIVMEEVIKTIARNIRQ